MAVFKFFSKKMIFPIIRVTYDIYVVQTVLQFPNIQLFFIKISISVAITVFVTLGIKKLGEKMLKFSFSFLFFLAF